MSQLIPIEKPDTILAEHQSLIDEIFRLASIQKQAFSELYLVPIQRFAAFAQKLPASEYHHHSYSGGLIEHVLSTIVFALRIRRKHVLPRGEAPERVAALADTYTFAVFVGAMLHDAGKVLTDVEVEYYSRWKRKLGTWNAFGKPLTEIRKAKYYTISYTENRMYTNHEPAGLIAASVVTDAGWEWLRNEPQIFSQLMAIFQGSNSDVADIVKEADQNSVATSLGADKAPAEFSKTKPIQNKMADGIKAVLQSGELAWNRQGAACYSDNTHVYVMSKKLGDSVRKYLTDNGHSGVPSDNNRIFDIMSENGLIELNEGTKAIYKVNIEIDDWKPSTFSMVKIRLSSIFRPENIPEPLEGRIIIDGVESVSITEGNKVFSVPIETKTKVNSTRPVDEPQSVQTDQTIKEQAKPEIEAESVKEQAKKAEPASVDAVRALFATPSVESPAPDATDSQDNQETEVETSGDNLSVNDNSPTSQIAHSFIEWMKSGLTNKTISTNNAKSYVHYLDIGVGMVSPLVFKEFARIHPELSWEISQKAVQKEKLNIKNVDDDSNVFTYTSAASKKLTRTKFWIIPYDQIIDKASVEVNKHFISV